MTEGATIFFLSIFCPLIVIGLAFIDNTLTKILRELEKNGHNRD